MAGEARAYTILDETLERFLETVDAGSAALGQLQEVRDQVVNLIPTINGLPYPQVVKDDCLAEAFALRDAIVAFGDLIRP